MKVKMKMDLGAIKGWLVDHGEKVAFGTVLLVFVLFIWSALGRETLDSSKFGDTLLKQKAQEARSRVEQSAFDAKREGFELVDYVVRAKRTPLAVNDYISPNKTLRRPIAEEKTKRDDPQFFPVEELRASAGFTIFEIKAAPGGGQAAAPSSSLKAQPWAVVTGLVPVKKQMQEYARVFQNAMGDKKTDVPAYRGFVIERAEINDAQPGEPKWELLTQTDAFEKQFSTTAEIVNAQFVDPAFTGPLGPLAGGVKWDEAVAHPKIPLAIAETQTKAVAAEKPAADDNAADAAQAANPRMRRAQVSPDKAAAKADAGKAEAQPVEIEYKLLRVFDYTVQPKKKYRYRVALGVEDPNFGLGPHMLKDPAKKREEVAETPMSEPSPAVTVPTGYRVLAAGAGGTRSEPGAKIMVSRIQPEEGIEAAKEINVWRGSVANTTADELSVTDAKGAVQKLTDVEIKTGVLVLDVRGGRPLLKKTTSPVEVLLLDPEGNLSVRNELDDQTMVKLRQPPEAKSKPKDPLADDAPKARAKTKKAR